MALVQKCKVSAAIENASKLIPTLDRWDKQILKSDETWKKF